MNLPNKLTILRIIMVPLFIWSFLNEQYILSLVIFCIASITDYFDGKIARERGLVTNFGKIMDPLADKILVYSALCLLLQIGIIQGWMLIVILSREFIVAGMRTVAASEGRVLAAGMSGKIKTVLQMAAVIAFLLGLSAGYLRIVATSAAYLHEGFVPAQMMMNTGHVIFWASLAMTVYSGCEYIYKNKEVFSM